MSFGNFKNKFQKPIPVKEGDTYDVTIESIGEKGDGIAKVEGYVIIVPKAEKGERVKIKVTAVRGKVSFGEIVEKLGKAEAKDGDDEDEEMDDEEEESEEADSGEEATEENEEAEEPKDEEEEN